MIDWSHYPKSDAPTDLTQAVVSVFDSAESRISSEAHTLGSNGVLAGVFEGLVSLGFQGART